MATGVSFTHYTEANILNALLIGTTFPLPSGRYLALFTASPGDAGGGTECSYSGYARQSVPAGNWGAPSTNTPTSSTSTYANAVNFSAPAASQTITAAGIYDAITGGNLLGYLVYGSPVVVAAGQPISVAAGALTLTVD